MTFESLWGPSNTGEIKEDTEIRFHGGFKSEKLGKIADWIGLENKARYRNIDTTDRDENSMFSVVEGRSGGPTRKSYKPQNKASL